MLAGPTVVITDSDLSSDDDEQVLREAGFATVRLQARTESEVIAGLAEAGADALIVQWAPVSGATLDAAPRCRFISRLGIGYDMIDVAAATERGVAVANTPDYCVDEVVAHALAMALWLLRGLGRFDAAVRQGEWSAIAPYPPACRPSQATIGVVGLGRIGARVAGQAAALGFQVLACDPYAAAPEKGEGEAGGVPLTTFEELLRRSDLVSLHAPLTDETRHLIDARRLALMKPDAVLVNTSRGPIVDEEALAVALEEGAIFAAGLDVYEREPDVHPRLLAAPRTVLLPHIGSASLATRTRMAQVAAENVVAVLAGGRPENPVSGG